LKSAPHKKLFERNFEKECSNMERGMDGDEMIERDRLLRELDSSFKTIITLVNKAFPSQTSAPTPSVVEPGKTRNNNQEPMYARNG
jgi:hypothetical protein